jgi:integrase
MLIKDREAYEWRRKHRRELEEELKPFLDKVYRRSQSVKSAESKYVALANFCSWCRKLPHEVIEEIKVGKANPYRLLDDFTGYLISIRVAPHSIKDYLSGVKKWLRFNEVEISNEKLREIIELPRQYAVTKDRIPTLEELRLIVYSCDIRGKALITLLASSGMRVGEALALRVKDLDFTKHPTRIYLRPEITKDRQERWCFISDEATELLKTYLNQRINQKESYIFQGRQQGVKADGTKYMRGKWVNKPMSYWNADTIFTNALKKAGLYEKDEYGRDVLHIHCLRKFFFTRMAPILGREITEALMGHKVYLDAAYRRFTIDELAEHYLRGMDAVTITKTKAIEREDIEEIATIKAAQMVLQLQGYDVDTEKLKSAIIKKRIELGKEPGLNEILEEIKKLEPRFEYIKNDENSSSNDPKKIVSEADLERYLAEGWDVQTVLPSGKILIRKIGG